jgi:Tol biopolymer transport system component
MRVRRIALCGIALVCGVSLAFGQGAPTGEKVQPGDEEKQKLQELQGQINGKIVWATSREHNFHDLWIMNADGTDKKPLTSTENNVDWFPMFSPGGSRVIFTRSKFGWVEEMDYKFNNKWDVWIINTDGSGEEKVAENATFGQFRPSGDSIVFARYADVVVKDLESGEEKVIFNSEKHFKKGAYCGQPEMSPNGKFIAITIRGTHRETGIWNLETNEWHSTGKGCEINWFPSSERVIRVNEGHGNGGTEILAFDIDENGKPTDPVSGVFGVPKKVKFMDLPGRRSHEYFPHLSNDGEWMVWGASRGGHQHDTEDYDLFIWKLGTDKKKDFVRLTFHTGNDRWPTLYVGDIDMSSAGSSSSDVSDEAAATDAAAEMEEDTDETTSEPEEMKDDTTGGDM